MAGLAVKAKGEPMTNPFQKEESTVVHNIRQFLGCLPVLGSAAVGILGLVAFALGFGNAGRPDQSGWLIGGSIGLVASALGFGVLAWVVWANRPKGPVE
jgi:hypothetical protein